MGVYSTDAAECETSLADPAFNVPVAENLEDYKAFDVKESLLDVPGYIKFTVGGATIFDDPASLDTNSGDNGEGACSGLVTKFYTGIWDPLYQNRVMSFYGKDIRGSILYAPLLPPYVMQWIMEWWTSAFWKDPPSWLFSYRPTCTDALQKFYCGNFMRHAQHQPHLAPYLTDYWQEVRPAKNVCDDYVDQCESNSFRGAVFVDNSLKGRAVYDPWTAFSHCSLKEPLYGNISYYPTETEVIASFPFGDIVRDPWNMSESVPHSLYEDGQMCGQVAGTNHPFVPRTDENSKSLLADGASSMDLVFWHYSDLAGTQSGAIHDWDLRICPGGWSETNPDCPWSFQGMHETSNCFKSCYQFSNYLEPMRDPKLDEDLNAIDLAILWAAFAGMSYMVATWSIFREKGKQRIVLVLSILMWLQTLIELLGYLVYPNPDDRFCANNAVAHTHGFNYCAVSSMLVLGIINPMFQVLIACMALDVYFKVILNKKNVSHYWKYYTGGSLLIVICFKFIPVFLYLEAAGFDGVNSCGYTFWLRQPRAMFSPTPVELLNPKWKQDLSVILLMNSVEHFAWLVSVVLFSLIIAAVMRSMKRVGSVNGEGESSMTSALKQIRLVKTPVLMIFFFSVMSAAQIYIWDVYAISNWKYFGPGSTPMFRSWYEYEISGTWYTWLENRDLKRVMYHEWETIDALTKIMSNYWKLIHHSAFPLLLFIVFGTHKDNIKLWLKKLHLEHLIPAETSSGGSSYDWTIVQQNQKLQKLGVRK